MWHCFKTICAFVPRYTLTWMLLLATVLAGSLNTVHAQSAANQLIYNKRFSKSPTAGYAAVPQKGSATVSAMMGPGTLLSGHFGVTLALQASETDGIGDDSLGAYAFDWNSFVPTLNTSTVDWVESDWIGYWRTNFTEATVQHAPAPGSADLDYSPNGGEPYDVEALYFDNDADSFYVAIVTSVGHLFSGPSRSDVGSQDPRSSSDTALVRTGDLSINLGTGSARTERYGSWYYDYGIDLTHENRDALTALPAPFATLTYPSMHDLDVGNKLYKTSSDAGGAQNDIPSDSDWYISGDGVDAVAGWGHSNFDPQSTAFTGSLRGTVRTQYYEVTFPGGLLENDYPTYVYEFAIPRSLFLTDNPGDGDQVAFRFMPGCRNDGNATDGVIILTGTVDDKIDLGDAPDTFGTLLGSNGPSHWSKSGYNLGASIDTESDGAPSLNANDDGSDEDGVTFVSLVTTDTGLYNCKANDLTVNLTNNLGLTAKLDGWIDSNGNGQFDHPAEHINGGTSVALTTGNNTVSVTTPCTSVNAATYARFRLSETGGLTPLGAASSGEVEDYRINLVSIDYGDAPDSYGTLNSNNGPFHAITPGLSLGVTPDADADGQPGTEATGDAGDEDGIPNLPVLTDVQGESIALYVNVTNTTATQAWLACWIDFDLSTTFDASEMHQASFSTSGQIQLDYTTPSNVQAGTSYIRCRVAFDQSQINNPTGMASSGEIEDYTVDISSSLPVELAGFHAEATGPTTATLSWSTLSEQDNAGFEIEYGYNGSAFTSYGFLEGGGTTDQAQDYQFRLDGLNPGLYRFRLKQVDISGSVWYSEVLELRLELPGGFVLEPAYPNPFGPAVNSPSTLIRFILAEREHVKVHLYDISGRLIIALFEGQVSANEMKEIRINGSQWPSGVYMVRLEGQGFATTQKLTLMR